MSRNKLPTDFDWQNSFEEDGGRFCEYELENTDTGFQLILQGTSTFHVTKTYPSANLRKKDLKKLRKLVTKKLLRELKFEGVDDV